MTSLRDIVERVARPIEFASRDAYAHLARVKNLGPFLSSQIIRVLAEAVYPPTIETDLLALRTLFCDYDNQLAPAERKRRLAEARMILSRLRMGEVKEAGRRSMLGGEPTRVHEPRTGPTAPNREPQTVSPTPLRDLLIRYARGVGPKRAALFERLGVRTVEEALWYLPWRYEDRSAVTAIDRLVPGMQATIHGVVRSCELKRTARRGLTLLDVTVEDGTGTLRGVFFNQSYLEGLLKPGARVMMSGLVSAGRKGWTDLSLESPHYEVLGDETESPLHVGRIVPIYHETRGLGSRMIRAVLKGLLDQYLDQIPDILPESLHARHRLPPIHSAIHQVHFPDSGADPDALERGTTSFHRRLAFEELFLLELALALRHQNVKEEPKGIRFEAGTPLLGRLRALLPFRLTAAQERVLAEIQRDMASPFPMNRLVQGDVGCGKTIVALCAMLIACGSGCQAALMVPTEVLAEQHYLNLHALIERMDLKAVLLKSGGSVKARGLTLRRIESGEAQIVIGTHALIQRGVRFARLGLAVIDEQHKFGVLQRKTLLEKGYHPDVLVMTATPIPRTLAMTVYGDMDVSVIDALPPGRKPTQTLVFNERQRRRAYQMLQDEIRAGRQGYIVYPLVEESEKVDLQAAIQAAERLQAREFRSVRVGLLHGRMKGEEKERTMAAFKAGDIQALVATTVVEVGVDVPNATVMVIEHAERFGLAQLHQLRGRVGRGPQQSFCLLLASGKGELARRRLDALVKSSDGFAIAEEDLRIRGPGEFFGVRQWGVPEFRAANLVRDVQWLELARRDAFALLADDPSLSEPAHRALRTAMLHRWQAKLTLGSIS